ncbi:MAG: phosphodiesterase [Candidatus Velthaea sp.]
MLFAQITDTHITRDGPEAGYLAATIAWINALRPLPAAVLVSGDTVDDGGLAQYAVLRDLLARCAAPVYVVPGNHDRREALRAVLPGAYFPGTPGERLDFSVDIGPLRIVGLDTSEQRRTGGILRAAPLDWLDHCLDAAAARPTLIFMHHPPFRTGVNAADLFGFVGLARFRAIVARRPAVRRIIAGHIHCERRAELGQALATTSISSIPQRVPELFEGGRLLGLRREAPGFATHEWRTDGFASMTFVNAGDGRFVARPAG